MRRLSWRSVSDVLSLSANKRTFRSLGGIVRGLDFVYGAKICVRELVSAVSRGLQGASRGLPLSPVFSRLLDTRSFEI